MKSSSNWVIYYASPLTSECSSLMKSNGSTLPFRLIGNLADQIFKDVMDGDDPVEVTVLSTTATNL